MSNCQINSAVDGMHTISPPRHPGERRDPYAVADVAGEMVNVRASNHALWLWVPAFAGRTAECIEP